MNVTTVYINSVHAYHYLVHVTTIQYILCIRTMHMNIHKIYDIGVTVAIFDKLIEHDLIMLTY